MPLIGVMRLHNEEGGPISKNERCTEKQGETEGSGMLHVFRAVLGV
jgi:hypothetical protein